MKKHVKSIFLVGAILALALSSCGFADSVADELGYVPKSQLDIANANLAQATKDLEATQKLADANKVSYSQIVDANREVIQSAKDLEAAKATLIEWQNLRCIGPDHKPVEWNDMINKYITFTPIEGYHAGALFAAYHFKVGRTQWVSKKDFDPYKGGMDTILFDEEYPNSFAIDITKDCLILGPDLNIAP